MSAPEAIALSMGRSDLGACCLPNGVCFAEVAPDLCVQIGGEPLGVGLTCDGDPDGDGVTGCADGCPLDINKTSAGACGCGEADYDGDGDGVFDCVDLCPNTLVGRPVDADGCAVGACCFRGYVCLESVRPEECLLVDGTFQGYGSTCLNPCTLACNADRDNDGDVDLIDAALLPDCMSGPGNPPSPPAPIESTDCLTAFDFDADGDVDLQDAGRLQAAFGTACGPAICGNGTIEAGEDCDPPTLGFCDDFCQAICGPGRGSCLHTSEGPGCDDVDCCLAVCAEDPYCCESFWDNRCVSEASNTCDALPEGDDCDLPIDVTDGLTAFDTIGATPRDPWLLAETITRDDCSAVEADIWFAYTATCTGYATVSLCASDFDTVLEIYNTNGCPTELAIACSDDGCGSGLQSRLTIPVVSAENYTFRVGGYEGETGEGWLTLYCSADTGFPACAASSDPCSGAHETPGCSDSSCCASVCALDAYCCDVTWDLPCAGLATSSCAGQFDACTPAAGACDVPNGSPGCENVACCSAVCAQDWHCCLLGWDALCAALAASNPQCP